MQKLGNISRLLFKNECSFAHGIDELRTDTPVSGSKNRLCKSFQEKDIAYLVKDAIIVM